jgi:uncharacterized protein (TIGR00730 family)
MPDKEIVNLPTRRIQKTPLTRQEMHTAATERISLITKEFTDGFNFLSNYQKSVTFFGGSHFKEGSEEYEQARRIGNRIAKELKYTVITGGGPGIMEAANRGAFEAGGESIGFTIELPHYFVQNLYLTKNLDFYYFFSRKVCLSFSAEAYLFFSGGFGTMDEFFEILTLVQTGKIEKMPLILVGSKFWTPLHELFRKELVSHGTIDEEDLDLYTITDDDDEIIEIIKNAPIRNTGKPEFPAEN